MSTALALVDNNHSSTYTDAENLARHIISRMESVSTKLRSLEDDIRKLWLEFDKLPAGQTILGCATKKEFCEKKLQRTPRTIQYLLAGQSNPVNRPHSELSSPLLPPLRHSPLVLAPQPATKPEPEAKEISLVDALDKFVAKIVMQPYGYYAAKFARYPKQHPSELTAVELAKREVYEQVAVACRVFLAQPMPDFPKRIRQRSTDIGGSRFKGQHREI